MNEHPATRIRTAMLFAGLATGLVLVVGLGLGSGAVEIAPRQVIAVLSHHLGFGSAAGVTPTQDAVLWSIRLPRVLLGIVVGAGLGLAGAAFQGIFRNPLADPHLIGISGGAAFGSVLGVLALGGVAGGYAGPLGGVAGGLVAGAAVYSLARHQGRTEVVTLILAGLAVGAIAGSGAAFVTVAADDARLGSVLFYALGSLSVATWHLLWTTLPFVALAILVLPGTARQLDLLLLGEREAGHLGVDVERLRMLVMVLATAAVGATVAAAGAIGFVGLLAPHVIRLLVGPGHRVLLPASAVAGAIMVVGVDVIARTAALPLEVPIGLLTALLGGPAFLVLLKRTRREHGGWG